MNIFTIFFRTKKRFLWKPFHIAKTVRKFMNPIQVNGHIKLSEKIDGNIYSNIFESISAKSDFLLTTGVLHGYDTSPWLVVANGKNLFFSNFVANIGFWVHFVYIQTVSDAEFWTVVGRTDMLGKTHFVQEKFFIRNRLKVSEINSKPIFVKKNRKKICSFATFILLNLSRN